MTKPIILDLCGGTGSWSLPYREMGYDVRVITLPRFDVREYHPPRRVRGVLAAPPCTEFSTAGARWWATKPPHLLEEALAVVAACQRIIEKAAPRWWALENPAGRLRRWLGDPTLSFHPYHYGDPWTKMTNIWGQFTVPERNEVPVPEYPEGQRWKVSICNHLSPTPARHQVQRLIDAGIIRPGLLLDDPFAADRATLRSITPPGWAAAFAAANP